MASKAIEARGLTKDYKGVVALDDLDLAVDEGEIFGFLGPNGAGKTTTIRLLMGFIAPTKGTATVFGLDARRDYVKAHSKMAYVPAEASLWPSLTGAETLALLGKVHGSFDPEYMKVLVDRFDLDPERRIRAYSKGNRQKVVLISGLMTRAPLLVLDEPTGGLDPLMEQAFRESIAEAKERGQTIFLSSHILSEVEALCSRVALLREGRLIEDGSLSEIRSLGSIFVDIAIEGAVPELAGVPGLSALQTEPSPSSPDVTNIHCKVKGPMEPLLSVLSGSNVVRLLSREPSLEEMFITIYESDQKR